jgi:hypothetical protein
LAHTHSPLLRPQQVMLMLEKVIGRFEGRLVVMFD